MPNFILQGKRIPVGDAVDLIFVDNGNGTFTMTVSGDTSINPGIPSLIIAGSGIIVQGAASGGSSLLPSVTGLRYPAATVRNAGAGDIDLYTAPAGKRALVGYISTTNTTVGAISIFAEIKVAGVYYRFSPTVSSGAGVNAAIIGNRFVLEPGESISVNTGGVGLNLFAKILEYDVTVPIFSPKVLGLANGLNTIYTVPVGKTALALSTLVNNATVIGSDMATSFAGPVYSNASGGARLITWYVIPTAGAADTTTQVSALNVSVADAAMNNNAAGLSSLSAGNQIAINTNAGTATQWAYALVAEV